MRLPLVLALVLGLSSPAADAVEARWPTNTLYRSQEVDGHSVFYREAGVGHSPTVVLLHGYPSSSHTYRELIPLLSGRYHVIAPDHLGSGYSAKPSPADFDYTFDALADSVDGLLRALSIDRFVLYMQDFGAPVGFRLMMKDPSRVEALIAQNANAYLEGIGESRREFFVQANRDRSAANVARIFDATSAEAIQHRQYLRDVADHPEVMSPDAWVHDSLALAPESHRRIQVKLFQDYESNLKAYPTWQAFLREHQFPTLLTWGARDPVFTADGARAYLRDLPRAELHLLDAGHFAVEEKAVDIARHIVEFLGEPGRPGTIEGQKGPPTAP